MRMTPRRTALPLVALTGLLSPLALGSAHGAAAKKPTLASYPRPAVTGKQLAQAVDSFTTTFAHRVTATPIQTNATAALVAELKSLGYSVEVRPYKTVLQAIVATKKGKVKPSEIIAFGGHFDQVPQTLSGTYDNGSGTRMVMGLARAFAKVPTRRTLQFMLFNGEEEGALASSELATDYKARKIKIKAYLGFDMVGIAWPVKKATSVSCLCIWRGSRDEEFDELLAQVNYKFLRFPEGKTAVSLEGRNVRNSDEASFADAGWPTLRWAGLRTASDYPEYHMPNDNMATIDSVAGGRSYFEAGLRNTLLSAYYTAAALDLQ
jgi:Zn-dependent M28 family amino/carboxypeptidase